MWRKVCVVATSHPPGTGALPVVLDCSYEARFPVNAAGEAYVQLSLARLCLLRVHWRTAGGSVIGTADGPQSGHPARHGIRADLLGIRTDHALTLSQVGPN